MTGRHGKRVSALVLATAMILVVPGSTVGQAPSGPTAEDVLDLLAAGSVQADRDTPAELVLIEPDGTTTRRAGSLGTLTSDLPAPLPTTRGTADGGPVPDVVVGSVSHSMAQFDRCAGYDTQPVGQGIKTVGGTWDEGSHTTQGVVPGTDTGLDLRAEHPNEGASHPDTAMEGAGKVTITYLIVLGSSGCSLLGWTEGTGTFAFDQDLSSPGI